VELIRKWLHSVITVRRHPAHSESMCGSTLTWEVAGTLRAVVGPDVEDLRSLLSIPTSRSLLSTTTRRNRGCSVVPTERRRAAPVSSGVRLATRSVRRRRELSARERQGCVGCSSPAAPHDLRPFRRDHRRPTHHSEHSAVVPSTDPEQLQKWRRFIDITIII
jgi:hypothetical protein